MLTKYALHQRSPDLTRPAPRLLRGNRQPADDLDVVQLDRRKRLGLVEGLEARRKDLTDGKPGLGGTLQARVVEPLAQHRLFTPGPRRLKDVEGASRFAAFNVQRHRVANEKRLSMIERTDLGLKVRRVGF